MMEYEDFSLKIEPRRGEVYPVIVLRSPAGEGRSSFRLPFDPDEIGDILSDLGQTVRGTGRAPLRDVSPAATRTGPQRIGDMLFDALFSGPVRSLLDRSLGMIHGRQRGLRIKLHIDPEDPSLAQLTSLPWEFLYRKETRDFLNLSRFTPILRYLDVQRPYSPLSLEPPLRILVVISAPIDYAPLDLDRERMLIEASWAKQEGVRVEFMEQATILALQDRLGEQPYHVLHYMGHGDFDERTGRGVLLMEDEGGQGAMVDGSTLGVLLRDVSTMRLVFLNACETAKVTKEKGLDPFAGVAAAMVMAGIPAVVAMQFPISDGSAITFAQKFYPLLARGDPVDAAVAEGRRAIRLAEAQTMEWGTPVLFMRAPQGIIFEVSEAQREKVPLPEIPTLPEEMDEELERRLAELYTRGLSAFWLEEWERAARSFQAIVSARPDYEDAVGKLAEAERQAQLHALYAQAEAAQDTEDWSGALAALEKLAAEAADFKDTRERLQFVRKQKQLADLYNEAQCLHQAEQWQAVVNVFGQIHAIEPDYADPDDLLPTAEQALAEQKRQAKLNSLYSRAVRGMNAGQWQEARQLLAEVQEMEPGFLETERLLAKLETEIAREEAERRRQEQIATLYDQASGLARGGQWQQVVATMEEVEGLDPQFADPEGLAARAEGEIERQGRLNGLYAQAKAAQEAEDWSGALSALEDLVAEAPGFRDAAALLERAKRQRQLAELYAEARQRHQARQWQAVVDTFAQIHAIEPEYPDPDGLLSEAEQEVKKQKRKAVLNGLYSRAVREMDAEQWAEARRLLARVRGIEAGYRETEQLLTRVEAEIERQEAERQREEEIATLYEQALGLARARQWRQVLTKIDEIQALDPEFADPEGIASRAREEVAREEKEARRQNELVALYAEAVRLLKAEQYQEALEKWGDVRTRDPRYPDRQEVQAKARKRLAALAKGAPPRRKVPRWAIAAAGGFAVVAVLAVIVLRDRFPIGRAPEATSTPVSVVAAVAATATDTPRPPTPTDTPVPPALDLRVNYGDDWAESFYEARHTVWITVTESDGVTVKAKAESVTEPNCFGGGEPGFHTQTEDWEPDPPDIQPYDWVYASVDNGARAQVQIGEIHVTIDFESDTFEGTVNAPWFSDEVNVDCVPWHALEPQAGWKFSSVLPDGEDTYACSWAGEWDIQPRESGAVAYDDPDGHWVANWFSTDTDATIVARAEADQFWAFGFSPYASVEISMYESKDPGAALLWEGSKVTDRDGFAYVDHSDHSLDLQPGNYLTVSDGVVKKGLVLELITIDIFDVEQDVVAGTASPGREFQVIVATGTSPESQTTMSVTSDPESGVWTADFKTISFDITEEMRQGTSFAEVSDDDGDANQASPLEG